MFTATIAFVAVLLVAAAADSVAIYGLVRDILGNAAPWLDTGIGERIAEALAGTAATTPIVAAILTWERLGSFARKVSPFIGSVTGPFCQKWSWVLNPLIGWAVGSAMGDGKLGLMAGGVWGILKSATGGAVAKATKLTAEGQAKAKALVLAGLLLGSGEVSAQHESPPATGDTKALAAEWNSALAPLGLVVMPAAATAPAQPPKPLRSRLWPVVAVGLEPRWDSWTGRSEMLWGTSVGWVLADHISLRGKVMQAVKGDNRWRPDAGVWLVF